MIFNKRNLLKFVLFLNLFSHSVFSQIFSASEVLKNEEHLLFDVRGSRGGKGDVSAAHLMAEEILQDHHYSSEITFVADQSSLKILSKLEGKNVNHGSTILGGRVRVLEFDKIVDADFPKPVTLVQHLARPSGKNYFQSSYREERIATQNESTASKAKIPYKGMLVVQTVLGNTENPHSLRPSGYVQFLDHSFVTPSAGLAANEAGIYRDVHARSLRNLNREELLLQLKARLSELPPSEQDKLKGILEFFEGKQLKGAQSGFAYGVTLPESYAEFTAYLKALRDSEKSKATVIFTPSGVIKKASPDPTKIHIQNLVGSYFPEHAEAGHVYLVQIPDVSRHTFNLLMALSDTPVVIAGDGALSGVLSLGKPFFMTSTAWNRKNRIEVGKLLKAKASPALAVAIDSVFVRGDLSQAIHFRKHSEEMNRLVREVADESRALLDSNLKIIDHLRKLVAEGKEIPAVIEVDGLRLAKTDIPALAGRLSKYDFIAQAFSGAASKKFDLQEFLAAFKPLTSDSADYIKSYETLDSIPDESKFPVFEKLYNYLDEVTPKTFAKKPIKNLELFMTANTSNFHDALANDVFLDDVKLKLLSEISIKSYLKDYKIIEKNQITMKKIKPLLYNPENCALELDKLAPK